MKPSGGTGPSTCALHAEQVYAMVDSDGGRAHSTDQEVTGMSFIRSPTLRLPFSIWLFQRGFPSDGRMLPLNMVPLGLFVSDMLENFCIVAMLAVHPAQPAWLAWLGAGFTAIKWFFAAVTILLILAGLVMATKHKFQPQ
jgi:hypothetical protein